MKALKSMVLSTVLCVAGVFSGAVQAATSDIPAIKEILDRGVLRVGVKNDVVGFSVKDPLSGEYKGFEDSLALLIAKEISEDLEVEFTAVTAATRSALIDSGDLDCVLATFTITGNKPHLITK